MPQRSVVVTGGASGIGLAITAAFVAAGDHVVSLGHSPSPAAQCSVVGDVRVPDDHRRAVEAACEALGGVDVLIANAGIHDGGADLSRDPDDLAAVMRSVFDVDVVGYVLAIQAASESLRERRGSIVMTLSDAAFLAGQTGAGIAYTAAKHAGLGVLGWTARALAPEVRVNAVAPGGVITSLHAVGADGTGRPLFDDADAKRDLIRSRNALGTVMEPAELAELYLWLASPAARTLTGEVLRPDGGLRLR
ncbi:MAG: SDR family oxidoreductase [Actinobacteria bacterium]|uniref:Unannotated protein n=1 Tax=freshwater metagenome TaxID=449393 RepID=A0A6J7NB27_9ZZZZ|nr:SDR family oxidoreductase [Actinomycetota bacterium]